MTVTMAKCDRNLTTFGDYFMVHEQGSRDHFRRHDFCGRNNTGVLLLVQARIQYRKRRSYLVMATPLGRLYRPQ